MAAPLITGTAAGSIVLPCTPTASIASAWGTVGSPTMLVIINPSPDTLAFVSLGTGAAGNTNVVVSSSNGTPIPPNQIIFLAIGSNTVIYGVTLRGGTQLTVIPST